MACNLPAQTGPTAMPSEVPSGFYLADGLIQLDKLMLGCLLVPGDLESKQSVAGTEAKRMKKLMGALRHLYRNCSLSIILPPSAV